MNFPCQRKGEFRDYSIPHHHHTACSFRHCCLQCWHQHIIQLTASTLLHSTHQVVVMVSSTKRIIEVPSHSQKEPLLHPHWNSSCCCTSSREGALLFSLPLPKLISLLLTPPGARIHALLCPNSACKANISISQMCTHHRPWMQGQSVSTCTLHSNARTAMIMLVPLSQTLHSYHVSLSSGHHCTAMFTGKAPASWALAPPLQ